MSKDIWVKEIMSLKIPNVIQKDITKVLILFYLIEYKKFNIIINIKEISKYVYEFYIDNPNISKYNPNSIIRNINKYNVEDIHQFVRMALYDWKSDYSNGCLSFNDNEIFVEINDIDDKLFATSTMIAKMLYRKATKDDFDYSPELFELKQLDSYELEYLNNTRLKNRVLEDMNYCCCCDKVEELFIVNISDDCNLINNPYNYITVCYNHYKLFCEKYYKFEINGKIKIFKPHSLLNNSMHISQKLMKNRKIEE